VSEQHDEESLRRWAREQAEIERQTDALVLRTLTAMVTAAEDLKSKLRRDTETILEEFRRSKRGLENEISLSGAERQRFRREAEQEREEIVAQAQAQARTILEGAEREREQLLGEVRVMEQRLRGLEDQIRSFLGSAGGDDPAEESPAAPASRPAAESPAPAFVPSSAAAGRGAPEPDEIENLVAEPVTAAPAPAAEAVEPDWSIADSDEDEDAVSGVPAATVAPPPPPATPAPRRAPAPTPPPPTPSAPVPAARAAQAGPRLVELVFDGVPGYQQASALERAVNDLLPGEEVDIVDFEQGQLVLNVQATDLGALADRLVAASSASIELEGVAGDRATFRCL
jgi:hypothetical protein